MSYSFSTKSPVAADDVRSALEVGLADVAQHLTDDSRESADKAIDIAVQIVESGVVGSKDKHFTVTVSGHANPGHEPAPGWANDVLTVSVYQSTAPDPAA